MCLGYYETKTYEKMLMVMVSVENLLLFVVLMEKMLVFVMIVKNLILKQGQID